MPSSFYYATVDNKSNILYQTEDFKKVFANCNALYELELFSKYKHELICQDNEVITNNKIARLLILNIFEKNYILIKFPAVIYNKIIGISLTLEEFKINNLKNIINSNINIHQINPKFFHIENFSLLQREIIFCLLIGLYSDKAIANFLYSKKNFNISTKSIRNAFTEIYTKLCTNDREHLTALCYKLNFDQYIPKTLFKSGIYNVSDILDLKNFYK